MAFACLHGRRSQGLLPFGNWSTPKSFGRFLWRVKDLPAPSLRTIVCSLAPLQASESPACCGKSRRDGGIWYAFGGYVRTWLALLTNLNYNKEILSTMTNLLSHNLWFSKLILLRNIPKNGCLVFIVALIMKE